MVEVASIFFVIMCILPIVLLLGMYWAWICTIMWGWFLVPLGLPQLSAWEMYGIIITINLIKPTTYHSGDTVKEKLVTGTCLPLIALGVGYIIKFWLM